MGEDTAVGWTHHTFNGWWGCTKVDELCRHCYAESFSKRTGHDIWGAAAPRRFFGDAHWGEPLKWNRDAASAGERRRVFCSSMADVFEDRADLVPHRARLWNLIKATPALDWLLLTKRPQNFDRMLPWTLTDIDGAHCGNVVCKAAAFRGDVVCPADECDLEPGGWSAGAWPNVWLGVSAGTQEGWDTRVGILMRTLAAVHFVSAEPLLEAIHPKRPIGLGFPDQVIIGGESGPKRRPMEVDWMEDLAARASIRGAKVFIKQDTGLYPGRQGRISAALWALKEFPR